MTTDEKLKPLYVDFERMKAESEKEAVSNQYQELMLQASLKQKALCRAFLALLADFRETREELPYDTREFIREALNSFTEDERKIIENYLNSYI